MKALSTAVRRFCKDVLRKYPLMKKELEALEEERQHIYESVPIATWRNEVRIKAVGDMQSRKLFRLMRLEEQWREVAFYVQAVDDLLEYLDDERTRLVELYYFDGWQPWQVAQELGMSESTFKRRHKEILGLLANRLGL